MSVRERLRGLASLVSNVKSPASEAQPTGDNNHSGRSPANSSENGSWTPFSGSGDALDVSPSGDARDRDDTQSTDDSDTPPQHDRQHSSRTTDLRDRDGHESWRGVYDELEADGWRHE